MCLVQKYTPSLYLHEAENAWNMLKNPTITNRPLSILTLQANHPMQLCPARFSPARANRRVWPGPGSYSTALKGWTVDDFSFQYVHM